MNCGAPAPGMNTAVRAAVRIGLDRGHVMLGVANGFKGLIEDQIQEMDWMSVSGWASMGGSDLGTNREIPSGRDFYAIARTIEKHDIHGLLMIGGFSGYQAVITCSSSAKTIRPSTSRSSACPPRSTTTCPARI